MPDISRKIGSYAIKYPVKIESTEEATPGIVQGTIWLVCNLEQTFYSCERLRQVLGLYPGSAASEETTQVSAIKINNVSELCKLGALGQLKVTLKAKDSTKTYGNLGQLHNTSFFYVLDKSIREVAADLRAVEIRVGGTDIRYTVVPGSIAEKKSKKTTPHF